MRKTVEVQMDAGMEARPIALMVQTANQFSSHLYLEMVSQRLTMTFSSF